MTRRKNVFALKQSSLLQHVCIFSRVSVCGFNAVHLSSHIKRPTSAMREMQVCSHLQLRPKKSICGRNIVMSMYVELQKNWERDGSAIFIFRLLFLQIIIRNCKEFKGERGPLDDLFRFKGIIQVTQ